MDLLFIDGLEIFFPNTKELVVRSLCRHRLQTKGNNGGYRFVWDVRSAVHNGRRPRWTGRWGL